MKKVTLVATTLVSHGGRNYGQGMQFDATEDEAEKLVKGGQATVAPPKKGAAAVAEASAGKSR